MFKNLIAPTFSSKRFLIRLIDQADSRDLYEICSDKEVTKHLTFEPYSDYQDARRVIVNMMRSYYRAESVNFAIVEKVSLKMVGSISLTFKAESNSAEIGYLLNRNFWSQHIMSEVLPALIQVAFDYYKLDYIFARTTDDNFASEHVLHNAGFVFHFTKQKEMQIHHEVKNLCYFEMNYLDYLEKKSN